MENNAVSKKVKLILGVTEWKPRQQANNRMQDKAHQ